MNMPIKATKRGGNKRITIFKY